MTTYRIILPSNDILDFYHEAINEYTKRLGRYCRIDIQYRDENQNLNALLEGCYCFNVTSNGQTLDSVEFSHLLQDLSVKGHPKIAFLVNMEISSVENSIALASLDLSSGLSLTCILEQLYRGYKILKNEPYHK